MSVQNPIVTVTQTQVAAKKWWMSKTLWTNVVILLITLITTAITQKLIAPEIGAAVLGIANIILRFLTNQPIDTGNGGVSTQVTTTTVPTPAPPMSIQPK